MTISTEFEAKILRYFHVEKWPVGTIARHLGLHHGTVDWVLSQAGLPKLERPHRAAMLDPFLPFVRATLEQYPRLCASRLYAMVRERGYPGGADHFRHLMQHYRPRAQPEAYLRLKTLPGEQAQVDWGHFGTLTIGRATRPLMAFVMVLSWSRQILLRFFPDARMASFLRGHEAAFQSWGGLPRVLLYDNLKSAVLERQGDAIRFHPTLLALAAHYRFEPRPVAVARGNEKGRVERAIRYVREGFFAARTWRDLDDLNAQADAWCAGQAADRPCPEERTLTVRQAFAQEQPRLLALPDNPFPTDERLEAKVGKTPYVRFDLNDYSLPSTHVQRLVTVVASPQQVRVLDGAAVIACHPRSYDQGAQIEDPAHLAELVARKRAARHHRGQDRLAQAAPNSRDLLLAAAARGENLGSLTAALLRLLDTYGSSELQAAITEALQRGVPHPNAVRLSLERRREQRDQPPPVPLSLPDDPRVRDQAVRPHALADYDQLSPEPHDDDHA
ncbi:IS21 family transposase [Candidatus Thiodictyon syntrophicum]|uniref:Integrase n=1 Tax=Candidatus Thiodictyon syntrophicum TaxID=1166950 RepID=A0A2K8UA11_9GAMM|nr:IS21 family transposase [Candidatus Thiodictyon syntrophicum]AUB82412.1 integrase [Candidatus Thiodictyon syntrophicum]